MKPVMKKKVLSDKATWYKSMDPAEKEKLLSHRAEWYKSLDPKEKKKTFVQISRVIEITWFCRKTIFYQAEQFGRNHWILHKSKRELRMV